MKHNGWEGDRPLARLLLSFGLLVGTLTAAGHAQAPPPTPPAPANPAAPAQPQPGTPADQVFRMRIDLVTTDAIARDGRGQFVADLTKDDFEIFEDGVAQDISSLVLVHGGRAFNLQLPPPPPPQEGIILPPARPTNDAAGRIFLLFVDDLHLDFRNTGRIRDLFKRISNTLIHDGDMFGIVSTGPSSIAVDLTYDRKRLDEAMKKISGNGLKPSDIIQGMDNADGPAEVRYRAQVAFSTAIEVMNNFEKVQNRRKAVVYVSNGYDFNPFPTGRLGEDPYGRYEGRFNEDRAENQADMRRGAGYAGEFAEADLARQLSDLTRAANRANATIYTVDPRGLIGGAEIDEEVDPMDWSNYVRQSQDSLRVIADLTGGIAVVNQNDFDRALKRIDAETSDYYVLGYYSKNPDPTMRTRKIEVKSKRTGVTVWSRTSYSLRTPPPVSSGKD